MDLRTHLRSQAPGCHGASFTCKRRAWWKVRTLAGRGPSSRLFAASLGSGTADVAPPVLFPSGVPAGDDSEHRQPTAAAATTAASSDALPEAVASLLQELQAGLGQLADVDAISLRLKQLAELLRGAPQWQLQAVRRHPAITATTAALASTAHAASPGPLCTALLAAAHLQLKVPRDQLEALGARLADATPSGQPDELVHGAWALSRLGFCTPRLLAAFEEQALGGSWLQELDVNGLTSLLWVCNRASFGQRPLLGAVMEGIRRVADSPQAAAARSSAAKWAGAGKHTRSSAKQLAAGAVTAADADSWAGSGGSSSSASTTSSGRSAEESLMTSRQVSVALYSCAAMRYNPGEEALAALCAQAQLLLPSFTPQGLSNTAWSLGRLGHRDPALMEAIAEASLRLLPSFSPHELALLASGFAGINFRHRELLYGIAARMADPELHCNSTDLSHVLGTLATLGIHPGEQLLAELEHTAVQLVRAGAKRQQQQQQSGKQHPGKQQQQQQRRGKQQASSQGHSNGAGPAAAAAGAAGGAGGGGQGGSVQPAAVCWVLWALARLGHQPRGLLRAAEELWRRAPVRLYELGPEDAGRLLWVLAKMEHRSGALLEELALVVRRLLPRMPPQSLAMVLHGYATLGFPPYELLDGAAEHMAAGLASYPPQSVGTMVWAFAKLGVHPGRGLPGGGIATEDGKALLQAAEEYAVAHAEELAAQTMALLCWGLATLHHHPSYPFLDAVADRMARQCLPASATQQRQQQQQKRQEQGQQGRVGEGNSLEGQIPAVGEGPVGGDTSQALSLVAWSFAQWGHSDERLHEAIHRTLLPHGPAAQLPLDLQPQEQPQQPQQPQQQQGSELAARATRAPEAGAGDVPARAQGGTAGPNLAPLTVSNFAFALAKQGVQDPALVHALRLAAEPQIDRYAPQELTNLLWCHASLGVQPPTPFLEAAVHALHPHLPTCDASLVALAVHSLATLRYAPPDDWLDEAVRCVVAAVQEELDEQVSLAGQEDNAEGEAGQGADSGPAGQGAATGAQQAAAWQAEKGTSSGSGGSSGGGGGGRRSRVRRRSRTPAGVHVTLLAKLLWGCANLGYQPSPTQLELLTDSAQWQLSHTRSRGTVLHASELVRLLWALAVLEQYHTSLYRNLCFRTSRLPSGAPRHPACIQLLRQIVMLSSCEARLVSLPLRGTNMLPEWLREDGPSAQKLAATKQQKTELARSTDTIAPAADGKKAAAVAKARGEGAAQQQVLGPVRKQATASGAQQQQEQEQQQRQQAEEGTGGSQASVQASEASAQASEAAAQQGGSSPAKAAAEAVAEALRRARCRPVAVRQLLFGDWVVVYKFEDSGQAAVLPWVADLRAANDESRAVGSAVATLRILAAKGFPVVLGGPDMRTTVTECLDLWT